MEESDLWTNKKLLEAVAATRYLAYIKADKTVDGYNDGKRDVGNYIFVDKEDRVVVLDVHDA